MKKYLFILNILFVSNLSAEICDLNNDDDLNVVDIVIMVNSILYDGEEFCDMNGDNELNIIDVVLVINTILYGFNIEFITIPAGGFLLPGSNEPINVDYSYQIGKYEVTNQQYISYLNDAYSDGDIWIGNCLGHIGESCVNGNHITETESVEKSFFVLGNPRSYELVDYYYGIINWDGESFQINDALYLDHPVIFVSWFGASHFAGYNQFRLPTYDEWMRAAREETTWNWPWSNSGSEMYLRINVLNSQYSPSDTYQYPWMDGTTPVGFYNGENNTHDNSSSFGSYDLIGNTWEWISDPVAFNDDYRRSLGGAWDWGLYSSRLKWIEKTSLGHPAWSTGFRVVKDLN